MSLLSLWIIWVKECKSAVLSYVLYADVIAALVSILGPYME